MIAPEPPADLGDCHEQGGGEGHDRHPAYRRDDAEQQRSVKEISQLFDIAGRESEVIAGLTGGMDQLRAVQAAKHALATLTPAEVRAALAYRRTMQPGPAKLSAGQPSGRPAGRLS